MATKNKPNSTKESESGSEKKAGKRTREKKAGKRIKENKTTEKRIKPSKKASSKDSTTDSILGKLYHMIRRTSVQLWFDVDEFAHGYLVVCKRKFVYIIVTTELKGQDHENMYLVFSDGQKIIPTKIRTQTFDGFMVFHCSKFRESQVIDKSAVGVIKFCKSEVSCHEKVYQYVPYLDSRDLITEGNVIKSEDGCFEHNCAVDAYSILGVAINKEGELVGISDDDDGYQRSKRASTIAKSLASFKNISKHVALLP